MKKFQKKYGKIENVSDHEFFTNSIHVPVWKKIDAFRKIDIESQLTGFSSAGCIFYFELSGDDRNNPKVVEQVVKYAKEKDLPYIACNFPLDTCNSCGFSGDFEGVRKCPKCGSEDVEMLRRVTGYLSTDYSNFNRGKVEEVKHRVSHFGIISEL